MLSASTSGRTVLHDIETVVIEWTHQIRDVLKKDSAQPLLEGLNPNPYVEIEFWNAKAQNLRCIFDQVVLLYLLISGVIQRSWTRMRCAALHCRAAPCGTVRCHAAPHCT